MNEEKVEVSAPAPSATMEASAKPEATVKPEAKAHRNIAILLLVGLASLGLMLWRVDHEMKFLSETLHDISEDVRSNEPAKVQPEQVKEAVVSVQLVKTRSGTLTFKQSCMGKLEVSESENLPYCLGENVLSVAKGEEKPIELDRRSPSSALDAPVLLDYTYVEKSDNVLLSYGAQPCVMPGSGGCLGGSEPRVSMAVDAATLSARTIANYPNVIASDIAYYWNPDGTKVAAVYGTCGEGGCTPPKAIIGYDLAKDEAREIANAGEEMAKLPGQNEPGGLPQWTSFTWTSPTEFTAVVTDAKGANTEVKGKME